MPVKVSNVKAADPGLSFVLTKVDGANNPIPFNAPTMTVGVTLIGKSTYNSTVTINSGGANNQNLITDDSIHFIVPFGDVNYNSEIGGVLTGTLLIQIPGQADVSLPITAPAEKGTFKPNETQGLFKILATEGDNCIYLVKRHGVNKTEVYAWDKDTLASVVPLHGRGYLKNILAVVHAETALNFSDSLDYDFLMMPNQDIFVIDKHNPGHDTIGFKILSKSSNYTQFCEEYFDTGISKFYGYGHFFLSGYDLLVVLPSNTSNTSMFLLTKNQRYLDWRDLSIS